jgi:hypothetical protein
MPVWIAPSCADDRDTGMHLLHERVGGCRAAAMVSNFEHVERPPIRGDSFGEQLRVDLLLDVTGEHHSPRSVVKIEDDRNVVYGSAGIGRSQGDCAGDGPQRVHAHFVESEMVARGDDSALPAGLRQTLPKCRIAGARPDHPRLCDLPDAIALHQRRQAADVILVRMCDDHKI